MTPDLSKCRTCLNGESKRFYQLNDCMEDNTISDMLNELVPQIHIKAEASQFSHLICYNCADKLVNGYNFQQLCIESNNRLIHEYLSLSGVCEERERQNDSNLVKASDPLLEGGFKMKQEKEENENFISEISPEDDLNMALKYDEWEEIDEGGGANEDSEGSDDTDSR